MYFSDFQKHIIYSKSVDFKRLFAQNCNDQTDVQQREEHENKAVMSLWWQCPRVHVRISHYTFTLFAQNRYFLHGRHFPHKTGVPK